MFIVDTIGIFLLMWFVQKYDRTAELKFQKVPLFFIFADGPLLLDADILKIVCLAQRKKTSHTWLLFHSRHVKWTHCLPKDSLSRCRCLKKKTEPLFHVPVIWLYVFVSISWLTFCSPMNCSLPGYSVHGIFQARILACAAISYSRGSYLPRDQTPTSPAERFLTTVPPGKPISE